MPQNVEGVRVLGIVIGFGALALGFIVLWFLSLWKRSRSKVEPRRTTSPIVWVFVGMLAVGLLLVSMSTPKQGAMQAGPPNIPVPVAVVIGVVVGFLMLTLVAIIPVLIYRAIRGPVKDVEPPKTRPAVAAKPVPAWVLLFLFAAVCLIVFLLTSRPPRRGQARPPGWDVSPWTIAAVVAASIVLMVGFIWAQIRRQNRKYIDRDATRALKRAQAGDVEGAMAELRAVLEERNPTGPLCNAMGVLHSKREEWSEALDRFVEAAKVSGREWMYLANQGAALGKLGRPEECVEVLREAKSAQPGAPNSGLDIQIGEALVSLGRLDEARESLAMAEAFHRSIVPIAPKVKRQVGEMVEELRRKIEAHPQAPGPPVSDEL